MLGFPIEKKVEFGMVAATILNF